MPNAELSGEDMIRQNMTALDAGESMPYTDDDGGDIQPDEGEVAQDEHAEEQADDSQDDQGEYQDRKPPSHMSEDEWVASGKDIEDYMSQEDFDSVGDMREDLSLTRTKMAREIVQTRGMVKEMLANQADMIRQAEDRTRNETIASLKAEQKQAIDYGETEKAVEIEREINKQNTPTEKEAQQPQQSPRGMNEFYQSNDDWYGVHNGATDLLNVHLTRSQKAGVEFEDAIAPAMAKVKGKFGELFDGDDAPAPAQNNKPNLRPRATSEKTRRPPGASSKKKTFNDLPPEMRAICKRGAKVANMTEAEYMEQM